MQLGQDRRATRVVISQGEKCNELVVVEVVVVEKRTGRPQSYHWKITSVATLMLRESDRCGKEEDWKMGVQPVGTAQRVWVCVCWEGFSSRFFFLLRPERVITEVTLEGWRW